MTSGDGVSNRVNCIDISQLVCCRVEGPITVAALQTLALPQDLSLDERVGHAVRAGHVGRNLFVFVVLVITSATATTTTPHCQHRLLEDKMPRSAGSAATLLTSWRICALTYLAVLSERFPPRPPFCPPRPLSFFLLQVKGS